VPLNFSHGRLDSQMRLMTSQAKPTPDTKHAPNTNLPWLEFWRNPTALHRETNNRAIIKTKSKEDVRESKEDEK